MDSLHRDDLLGFLSDFFICWYVMADVLWWWPPLAGFTFFQASVFSWPFLASFASFDLQFIIFAFHVFFIIKLNVFPFCDFHVHFLCVSSVERQFYYIQVVCCVGLKEFPLATVLPVSHPHLPYHQWRLSRQGRIKALINNAEGAEFPEAQNSKGIGKKSVTTAFFKGIATSCCNWLSSLLNVRTLHCLWQKNVIFRIVLSLWDRLHLLLCILSSFQSLGCVGQSLAMLHDSSDEAS